MKSPHARQRRPAEDLELRQRALERMQQREQAASAALTRNPQRLLHELQVHQVELEMQNEQLEAARAWVEAALASYTELFDFAPVPYFSLDHAGTMVEINLAGARLLGSERARLLDKRLGSFVSEADRKQFAACLKSVFANQSEARCEVELVATDGARRTVEIRATMSNKDANCRAVLVDISERCVRERRLARLGEVFSLAREGMLISDQDGRIVAANHALADLTGYTREQLEGQSETWLRSASQADELEAAILQALAEKGSWSGEVKLIRRDGGTLLVTQHINTMLDGQGAMMHVTRCSPILYAPAVERGQTRAGSVPSRQGD